MQSQRWVAILVGAIIGGVVGYMFFTDEGRNLRHHVGPAVDDFSREVKSFRRTVEKAANVASEGYGVLNDVMGYTGVRRNRQSFS